MVDPEVIATVTLAGLGIGVWALRLEGRITTHEKTDALIHSHVTEALEDLKQDTRDLMRHFGIIPSERTP